MKTTMLVQQLVLALTSRMDHRDNPACRDFQEQRGTRGGRENQVQMENKGHQATWDHQVFPAHQVKGVKLVQKEVVVIQEKMAPKVPQEAKDLPEDPDQKGQMVFQEKKGEEDQLVLQGKEESLVTEVMSDHLAWLDLRENQVQLV